MFIVSGRHGVDRFRNFIGFFAENARLYNRDFNQNKNVKKNVRMSSDLWPPIIRVPQLQIED